MNDTVYEKIVLIHTEGERVGDVDSFQQANVTIGRAPGSRLMFESRQDRSVSGHHAVIRQKLGQFGIVDVHSTNGTFVNGEKIDSSPLKDGDLIRFGMLGPEVRVSIPSMSHDHTTVDRVAFDFPGPEEASRTPQNLTDPHVTERVARARYLRFVRNTMVAAISVAAAMTAFVWTIIEGAGLSPAAVYFKSFLWLVGGGVLAALVFSLYHGRPGKQKAGIGEILWIITITVTAIGGVIWSWRDFL